LGATETMAGTRQMLVGRVLVAIAAAGTTASLIVIYAALRAVLSSGGFCVAGGAYAVAHHCNRSDTVLLLMGTLGMLTFGGLLTAATAWMRGPVMQVGLALQVALFATLGWNFIDRGANPTGAMGTNGGLIATGVALGLMTLIGLTPLVRMSSSRSSAQGAPRGGHMGGFAAGAGDVLS
jgi:hypothetical protein